MRLSTAEVFVHCVAVLSKGKRLEQLETLADIFRKSYQVTMEDRNRIVYEVIRVLCVDHGKAKVAESLLPAVSSEIGEYRFQALVACGRLLDAYGEAVNKRDHAMVDHLRRVCRTPPFNANSAASHVADLAHQYLKKNAPQLL
jgi:hypothetical protein